MSQKNKSPFRKFAERMKQIKNIKWKDEDIKRYNEAIKNIRDEDDASTDQVQNEDKHRKVAIAHTDYEERPWEKSSDSHSSENTTSL